MSLEAVRDFSIIDLLRALSEKLDLECTRLRETRLAPAVSPALLESEVSTPRLANVAMESNLSAA
jgi:hypothetical protein